MMNGNSMENGDVIISNSAGRNNLSTWWLRLSKNERKGTGFFLACLTVFLIGTAIYFYLFSEKTTICKTTECRMATTTILRFIDQRQQPCQNFYRFACGTFLDNVPIEDPQAYYLQSVKNLMKEEIEADIKNMLEEEIKDDDMPSFNLAKKFYRACMNEGAIEKAGLSRLSTLFEWMGGWPVLDGDDWDAEKFNWAKAIKNLRDFGVNFDFFFNLTVEVDKEQPDRYILGIHDRFYSPADISMNSKVTFLDYMVDVAMQFNVKSRYPREELDDVLTFLLNLGKISEESKEFNKTFEYNLYSLYELQTEFSSIPWIEHVQGLFRNSAQLRPEELFNVPEPFYLKKLENLLKRTNKRIVANFMGWHLVQSLINYLPSKILDRAYDYLRKVNGNFLRKPRWSVCIEAVRERLSAPINIGYIERHFDEETRANVTNIVQKVKYQFKKNVLMADWLDKNTKKSIVKMLQTSVVKIYSYSDFLDVLYDNSVYSQVNINEGQLLKAVLDLDLIYWDLYYGTLRQPVKDDWIKTQTFISGQKILYLPTTNVLRKHSLSLFITSWDNRYMKFILKTNTIVTRDEDMADLTSFKIAYETYTEHEWRYGLEPLLPDLKYTGKQLFWISSALQFCSKYPFRYLKDKYLSNEYEHSPSEFRVNGPLQNIQEFADDFKCSQGNFMNPKRKCLVW
ncbi:hypothetical protein ABEB36_013005 [Hypothenemus hampei]|uniref:Uncharacterized protein n=1 Tax=Hypothenemus hampei TaxID=57062 RepID=A0ABD1EAZ5_HYPHA